ncbi:MAG: GNAT family N-acetyltransferase [Gordonia sp. (in: high G+C Gram-positive bacteria)]|uniref:GNAT family N-acetyltransferase n=1 Tax=Gordonia sp. (in: high G+C Gram-positive bacteria) TaxID=84139 RepID=UPI003BB803A4
MHLFTSRLLLRPVDAADVDLLAALDADAEVMRFVSGGVPTPTARVADWVIPRMQLQQQEYGTGMWLAFDAHTMAFVGWVQMRTPRHSGALELELSYRLRRETWGHGLAREAASALIAAIFTSTPTTRIFAGTDVDHHASRRVLEALGMRLAADTDAAALTRRDACLEYEILRSVWAVGRGRGAAVSATAPPTSRSGMTA